MKFTENYTIRNNFITKDSRLKCNKREMNFMCFPCFGVKF